MIIKQMLTISAYAVLSHAATAVAQNYPTRAVRIVVPYVAGGNTDFTARHIGARLSEVWGHQIIIDNRQETRGRAYQCSPSLRIGKLKADTLIAFDDVIPDHWNEK